MINGATWNGIGGPRRPGSEDHTTQMPRNLGHGCGCGFRANHVFSRGRDDSP